MILTECSKSPLCESGSLIETLQNTPNWREHLSYIDCETYFREVWTCHTINKTDVSNCSKKTVTSDVLLKVFCIYFKTHQKLNKCYIGENIGRQTHFHSPTSSTKHFRLRLFGASCFSSFLMSIIIYICNCSFQ